MEMARIESKDDKDNLIWSNTWVLVTSNHAFLNDPAVRPRIEPPRSGDGRQVIWTDDYSNLVRILN